MSTVVSYLHTLFSYFIQLRSVLTSDIVALGVIFAVFLAYIMFFGRNMMISLILAFYPSTLLYKTFPFIDKLMIVQGERLLIINKGVIFLIFLVPLTIIISRYVLSESVYTGSSHIIRTLGFALAGLIMVLLFSYGIVNLDPLHNFSISVDALFVGADKIFYWNLAPLLLLAVL